MALHPAGSKKNAKCVPVFTQARKFIVVVALLAVVPPFFAGNSYAVPSWSFTLTTNLPSGVVGVSYSGVILASGGTAPYSFAVSDGVLPAGLTLNSTTGAITGTPSAPTTKFFWIKVTDANGKFATSHQQITVANGSGSAVSITISPTSASVA